MLRTTAIGTLEELAGVPAPQGLLQKQAVKQAERELIKSGLEELVSNPRSIWGKSIDDIVKDFSDAGYKTNVRQSTKGSMKSTIIEVVDHKKIQQIQVHPGGGRHGGSYYKISTTNEGIIKVVDKASYKGAALENATIIYSE